MKSRSHVRYLGLLGASLAVIVLASCGGDSTQESTTTAAINTATTASTTTTASSTTTAPTETTETAADFDVSVDASTEWGEVFEALTTTEQECVRDSFEGELLESVLARPVMSESDTPEAWEVSMFSCLAPQTARAVFLALLVAGMEEDGLFLIDADARVCLNEWVSGIDVVATMVALSADDAEAAGEVTTAFMRCNPDLFTSLMLEETGLTLDDLSEEEATCLREWAADTNWATLLTGDDLALLGDFLPDLIACAPDMFIASVLEDTGLTLDDLSEEEATCLREWAADTDWATLLAGDDFAVLVDFLPDLFSCAPDMFIASVLEDTGLTLDDLSEEEATCLREWVTDFDWATLFTGFADDSLYLFELLECVPDLSWSDPGDLPWDQVIEEATPIGIGVAFQGELDLEGAGDYFTFEAEQGDFYQLDVTLGTLEDSVLDLYDADGTWLDSNDDYGETTASRLVWDAPGTGTYYVQVTSFGTGTGTYTLTISGITDDHANSAANAVRVDVGLAARGAIDYEGDGDYFAFAAEEGELYQLDVTLGTLEDSVLDIFDTYGIWLDGNDDSAESAASRLYWIAPGTGTYYVRVTGFDVGTGTYTLTIALSDIVDDHPDSTADATPVEIGVDTHGAIDYEGDRDYFAFEAQEGEYYQLDVTLGTLDDSILELFDADGIWLDANDDSAESTASRLIWLAPGKGTYNVQVASFRTGTGTYTLTIAISDIVDDHPNSADNATPVEIGVSAPGELEYEGDVDYFTFEATEGGLYELDVTRGSLQESVLDIFDADGTWLAGLIRNDNTVNNNTWYAPGTGTYNVQVTSFDTGTYTLTIAISDIVDDHPNSADNATPVEIGVAVQGELEYEGDGDFFAFEATAGESYELDVTLGTLQDSVLDLYDADGTWLDGNDDYGDSTASRLTWTAPSTGTYYVEVTDFGSGTGTYTLTIATAL